MQGDDEIRELLRGVASIAVVGIKDGETEDAYRVARYMQERGYRIVPVNPKLERVLGERAWPSLAALRAPVDLVDVFRAPRHLPALAEEILALSPLPRAVWLQLGIRHDEFAARLAAADVAVVQDRCLMVEHARLLRGDSQ
jgi:predicted CoA-binding protein